MHRIKFKDFITLQRGFDLPKKDRIDGHYPVVASTSIAGYHNEFKVEPPGVTTGRSGSLGEVLYLEEKFWPLNTSLWVKDFKGNLPHYVYYFLKTLNLQDYNSGAGVPTLNRNHLDSIEIDVHDENEQRKIASILSAFDDLIENNTRRIAILEEMARLIYREWFVLYRYPGHENDRLVDSGTELGEVPEGWEVREVDEVVNRLPKGNIYRKKNIDNKGEVIVIDQSTDDYLGFHNNEPDFNASFDGPFIIFGDHTCKIEMLTRPFSLGPNVVPFIPKNEELSTYYLYWLVEGIIESREYKRHWSSFKVKKVVLAPVDLSDLFERKVKPIYRLLEVLKKKNRKLKETRDLLLPKFISGKIDINNFTVN